MRVVSLETRFRTSVGVRPEISVRLLGTKDGLNPDLSLILQSLVIKNIRQRKQAVNPVRSSLPSVSVTAQPGVTFADNT